MNYKEKIANIIVDEVIDKINKGFKIEGYCEPFCGMLEVYQYIPILFEEEEIYIDYLAGSNNESIIKMWQEAQKGWIPPTYYTKSKYNILNNCKSSSLKGFKIMEKLFTGLLKTKKASRKVVYISNELYDVEFIYTDYKKFSNLKNFVIYCNPPNFYDLDFWRWCKKMSKSNIIFVNQNRKPRDVKSKCVYSNKNILEKLFMLNIK